MDEGRGLMYKLLETSGLLELVEEFDNLHNNTLLFTLYPVIPTMASWVASIEVNLTNLTIKTKLI